jgi:hypothetical protein
MDEVSLYARALSQTEIEAIYQAGAFGKCHQNNLSPRPEGALINVSPFAAVANGYEVNFRAEPNHAYLIQRSSSLNGPWETIAAVWSDENGLGRYVDTNAHSQSTFYRVMTN